MEHTVTALTDAQVAFLLLVSFAAGCALLGAVMVIIAEWIT
jgi:hypothetical protein